MLRSSIDDAQRGFTLVEVVVALTLVAAVMLGMASAMRTLGQTAIRLDEHVAASEELRTFSQFLRLTLESLGGDPASEVSDRLPAPTLVGQPGALEWIGAFPARYGVGGMHRFRIFVDRRGPVPALVLEFAPMRSAGDEAAWNVVAPAVRLDRVTSLAVRYRDKDLNWSDTWNSNDEIPVLLSIALGDDRGDWPELVIEPERAGGPASTAKFTVGQK